VQRCHPAFTFVPAQNRYSRVSLLPMNPKRPLAYSLSRFKTLLGIAAALGFAGQQGANAAPISWEGSTGGTPGDGFQWLDPLNWQADTLPAAADDLIFEAGTPGVIHLGGAQTLNSLFVYQDFTLGAYGTNDVLNNTTGTMYVDPGAFATINASYGGANGISLSGGGSLFLNHPLPTYAGNITVDGTGGTTLVVRGEGPYPQYNAIGGAQEFGRFDPVGLGFSTTVRTITLTNGAEYKIIGAGNNPEGGHKNIVIGAGGGTINLAAGYLVQNLDDTGQLTATTETFTKAGKGRLIITGTMATVNPLGGTVNVNGGMLSLDNQAAGRFLGVAAGGTININAGGTLFINNGTQARLDVQTVNANNGSIIGINGNEQIIGLDAGGTTLNITGTATLLARDLFGPQTQRFPRLRTALTGTGTLNLLGNTNAGGTPRLVIERGSESTFSGTFRVNENVSLEAHPRNNPTANVGKAIADGDIEFAGWGSTLDVRDSDPAAANVKDYTTNEITVTTTQSGALNTIAPVRATAATGAGHLFNFGTLTMGNHRIVITGNNNYQTGFADTASITGDAAIIMNADNSHAVFSNAVAISEDAAGRSLTLIKAGAGNAVARDVIVSGAISLSNLELAMGTLQLRGAAGSIGAGFGGATPTITVNGGANNFTNGLSTQGLLHLDSNTGHVVGTTTVIAVAENNNRIVDSATLDMRSNSILRLTSLSGSGTTETIGTTNVSGHATFDIVKNGTAPTPVALTLSTFNMVGTKPTANFTGTSLGLPGTNTSRIILNPSAITPTGFLGAQFHSGNEWAKYNNTVDNGFELGVTPFAAADYTIDATTTDAGWAVGQQLKLTSGTGTVMSANRNVDRVNLQIGVANQAVNLAGFVLTADQGGILVSGQTTGIIDGPTNSVPSGTAGITSSTGTLFVHNNSQLDLRTPVIGAIDFVKSGTATLRLTHQNLAVGTGVTTGLSPFVDPTWTSTLTGSWIINDGRLDVHRGQFLGGRPVILNGGHLEINEPVSNANADTIIPGWGNDIIINGNATVAADDNAESQDASTGDRAMVKLGSLTINNGAIFSHGAFSDMDIAYMGGATFNDTPTLASVRGGANAATIINGTLAGTGFNLVNFTGSTTTGLGTVVLGGTQTDAAANTYNGAITIYAGTLRVNKANGTTAITDGAAAEDVVINGGALLWGPSQHGDLSTTNSLATTNNNIVGIAPTSPAAIKNAGMNQIADTATITLLSGTLGEADRINNDKWSTLNQRNGTFNVGLGAIEVDVVNIFGGAFGIDRGGSFKAGTLSLNPGSPDLNITTGIAASGLQTTLEVGAGGLTMTGQNIILGSGSNANVAGTGAVLKLGGDVTANGSDLVGGSYGRKGIFIQTGNSFREYGDSHIDLLGGNRTFTIGEDTQFTVTAPLSNGGLIKAGGGGLILESYYGSDFAGPVTVNNGTLWARANGVFGTGAGGVTINTGGTIKLESGWTYGDAFTVSGAGATVPGDVNVREPGALISETGTNRITGGVSLGGNATIASNTVIDVSITPATGGAAYRISNLRLENAAGITGAGTLTLSGHGDGVIFGGVNTSSGGLVKDGAGRWTIGGASTMVGPVTIAAGNLRILNAGGLGSASAGTNVIGGSLEIAGGISLPEPLTLHGSGSSTLSGALVNVSGANTLTSAITVSGNATLRSDSGSVTLASSLTGGDGTITLTGSGNGAVNGALETGTVGLSGVVKSGTGTWTLAGANTVRGTTTISGGTLELDYRTQNNSKVNAGEPLIMGGGSVRLIGNATAGTTQLVSALDLIAGAASISLAGGVNPLIFSVGPINRSPGATVDFNVGANGLVVASPAMVNNIIGGYATYGGTDWASLSGNEVVRLTTYTPINVGGGTDADDSIVSAPRRLSDNLQTNSLKLEGGVGLALDTQNLKLTSGGLLYTGSGVAGIAGSGTLSGISESDELIIHTASGLLDIATPIIGNGAGSLTKTGAGTLVLSGTSSFTGSVNINGGTLLIPAAPTFPGTLGTSIGGGNRLVNLNGGTFGVMGDWDLNDWDTGAGGVQSLQFNVGPAGGTLKTFFGGNLTINDGSATAGVATQLMGNGDLTLTGGGRFTLSAGTPQFLGFGGNVKVESSILVLGHSNSLGGRQEQTLTLSPGSVVINNTGFGLGLNGLPNNIVSNGGVDFHALGGNRAFAGNIQLGGTNTIALMERDTLGQERQIFFNGRVSGENVTLNVFGGNNANPFFLASGANDLTGTINLNTNAVLEVRMPGSLGVNEGGVTVNLNGINSRLLLRHYQNADYHANVVVNADAEINSDRLNGYGGGGSQLLTINNLTSNTNGILTIGGANAYVTRVAGTTTLNANTILNVNGSNALFENGITFANGATTLEKRGANSLILRGPSNHAGSTIVRQGSLILQDGATLANTSDIQLRGGELRIDNSAVVNPNRVNDGASFVLGGGTLRITGNEAVLTSAPFSVPSGHSTVVFNQVSETVVSALTLPGLVLNREKGATLQFQTDLGPKLGETTLGQSRISSRIILPDQLDVPAGDIIPWAVGLNALDFVAYDGTTIDGGQPRGVIEYRNTGTHTYTLSPAETAFVNTMVARFDSNNITTALTADRSLRAMKLEGSDPGTGAPNSTFRRMDLSARTLTVERGAIINVSQPFHFGNSNTATSATLTSGTEDLIFTIAGSTVEIGNTSARGTSTGLAGAVVIADGLAGPVSLIKNGAGTLQLRDAGVDNTFSGGVFVNGGTLEVQRGGHLGTGATVQLAGGTLNLQVGNAGTDVSLPGFGQHITVRSNSLMILDNGGAGTDNNFVFGNLMIDGSQTFGIRGFDSQDAAFIGTHTFDGTPTIDLPQLNNNATGGATTVTINGAITGSGFYINSTGAVTGTAPNNSDNSAARLQIGGGEATPNTYTGKVTIQQSTAFSEDVFVELNKAGGTTAITGDLQIDGGSVLLMAGNQIADSSNLLINRGVMNFNGQSETIASVNMKGGGLITNPLTGTPVANTINIAGNVDVTGMSNFAGVTTGFTVGNNSTVNVGGVMRIGTYGRVHLSEGGDTGGFLNLNAALEMTGATLHQNSGTGPNTVRLGGDVTTFASSVSSNIGNSNDSDTFLDLNGTRTFTVADGTAAVDLVVSTVVRDGASPSSFIKAGDGTVQIQGAGNHNTYSSGTFILSGSVVLFKSANFDAIPAGPVALGDGLGGVRADRVIVRNNQQIADAAQVAIASSGLLDLETFNTSETIGSLTGSGNVDLGPNSTFTVNSSTSTDFSGGINGAGNFVKDGSGILKLNGTNQILGGTVINGSGGLLVNGVLGGNTTLNSGTLGGDGSIDGTVIVAGGVLSPGDGPGSLDTGNLNLGAGTFAAEIMGLSDYDSVNVTGVVILGGSLSVSGPFVPTIDDAFYLILNDGTDSIQGTFAGIDQLGFVMVNGVQMQASYTADFEGGNPYSQTGNDFALIPEPGSASLLLGGLGSLLAVRRRRRNA
jgi:fibronectin-binding autotransporter adhesin